MATLVAALALPGSAVAAPGAGVERGPRPPDATTSSGPPADLDAMFIGAHPDDEAGTLSTFGQWDSDHDVQTGVITITRGEGGGNAVGPEEGPALGLIREREERAAVAKGGITDIYNLDEVDFYYTVSEPLTAQVWDHDETLAKTVRILRQTRPEVLVTMNPAPSPGQHGNHQESARIAVEAYRAAGDPSRFPEQITREGLKPFSPDRILLRAATGTSANGPGCAKAFVPADPSQTIYGVWSGTASPDGRTWAAVERDAQREYASQGWAGFPDVSTNPAQLGCDHLTLVDSRTPVPQWGSDAAYTNHAPLDGSLVAIPGGLPLGSGMTVDTDRFRVLPGAPFTVTVGASAPEGAALGASTARLELPAGWTVTGNGSLGTISPGAGARTTFTVTPAAGAAVDTRVRIKAFVESAGRVGYQDEPVLVSAPVTATQQLLPQVEQFREWAHEVDAEAFADIVRPVLTLASGGTRPVDVVVMNHSATTQSGTVTPTPPAGFTMSPATAAYSGLAPGARTTVRFTAVNTDTSLKTSVEGGVAGDHLYSIAATSTTATGTTQQAFELVPTSVVPQASTAPTVDGVVSAGEYAGPVLDVSRRWEGEACTSDADCSATAQVTWRDDTLFVAVTVKDDVRGTPLAASDCKRHWRTDSVEIAIDPRGTSENTSTTFKAAILPWTAEGGPCYLRDADAHQGDGPVTAPGMKVASKVTQPYTGYVVETAIPMSLLPSAVDPAHMGLNVLPYDSDTQDKTGQTRLGWSVWGGVQGDPYRWGDVSLEGYVPPAGRPTTPADPVIPTEALQSVDSPQSIEQAVRTNVALAGRPSSTTAEAGWVEKAKLRGDTVELRLRVNDPGTAHVTVRDADGIVGQVVAPVAESRSGLVTVSVPLTRDLAGPARALVGWDDGAGGTFSSLVAVK
ncbi:MULTISPECIES: sugar-binding protein [unclassified Knoellia]|uniref:sugar-binding protein n=1 Tax=Knoellia altitudinis TaxID=3404795 RepID=UPI00361356BC